MKTLVKPESLVSTKDEFIPLCETTNCGCHNICKAVSYADEENDEILF